MKAVIIEDEIHNRRLLEGMIQNLRPEWEIVNAFDSVKSSVQWLKTNQQPDLIFMDIQLIDGICFSIFEQVDIKSMVIFTTAYDEYAIQAFKVNSIDYLLKPIKEHELEYAILSFEKLHSSIQKEKKELNYQEILEAIRNGEKKYRQRFLVSGSTAFTKIATKDIAYFFSEQKITFAVDYQGKNHPIDHSLDRLEHELDPEHFFRANRQFVLNIDAINKIESHFAGKLIVKLIAPFKEKITISRLKAANFKKWIDK